MRFVVPLVAGLWLFAVGVQGVAFLVQYGLLPLPPEIGRLDFTPQYTLLMALVIIAAILSRLPAASTDESVTGKRD
jgi:hypothetical protein